MLRRIGRGSYGDVWIARTATGVYRAVKVVWRDRFIDEAPYEREFRGIREFEKISLIEPRQLALLHVGRRDEDGFFYYVMELADDVTSGSDIHPESYRPLTLREIRKQAVLPVKHVVELGVEMARGLAVLHDHGLVHRDIKPSNVVLVGGVPKLADIGLVASATLALTFVGTEGFVAPEGPGSPAADVFALGKVLYELVTGLDRNEFPQLPADFTEREDRTAFLELNAVVLRACDPDLKKRHEHARALLEDLLLLQAGRSVRRLRAAERGLARALKAAAVLAAVAAVAGAGAWFAWERAQDEMALRAEAEAERDRLARKTRYAGLLAQASRAIDEEEFGLARQMLAAARRVTLPAPVGSEWNWLEAVSWGDAQTVVRSGGPALNRLVIHPNGQAVAMVDRSGVVEIWDIEEKRVTAKFEDMLDLAGWSIEGDYLLGTNRNGEPIAIRVVDGAVTGAPHNGSIPSRMGGLWPIGVSIDGEMIAVEARKPGRLWAFEPIVGRVRMLENWLGPATDDGWQYFRSAISADRRSLAVAWVLGQGAAVKFLLTTADLGSAEFARIEPKVRPGGMAWIPGLSGRLTLQVVDDVSGSIAEYSPEGDKWVESTARLEPGTGPAWIFGQGADQRIYRARGALLLANSDEANSFDRQWAGHGGAITQVVALGGESFVFTGSENGEVLHWEENQSASSGVLVRTEIESSGLRFNCSPDGSRIYVPDNSGVRVIAVDAGIELTRWDDVRWVGPRSGLGLWGISIDGRSVVAVNEKDGVVVFRGESGDSEVMNIAVTESSVWFTRTDGSAWVNDLNGGSKQLWSGRSPRWGFVIDQSEETLWYASAESDVSAWDTQTGIERWTTDMPAFVSEIERLPAQGLLVAAVANGEIHLIDEHNGDRVVVLSSGSSSAESVQSNTDGSRIWIGGDEGRVHVFETENWLHLATFRNKSLSSVWQLAASDDESKLFGLTRIGEVIRLGGLN